MKSRGRGAKIRYEWLKTKSLDAERLLLLLLVECFCIYENSKLSLNDSEDVSVAVLIANLQCTYSRSQGESIEPDELLWLGSTYSTSLKLARCLFVPMSHVSDIIVTPRILIFIISMFHFLFFQSITTGQRTEIEH